MKKEITLTALAKELGGELVGDGNLTINGIRDIEEALPGDLAFILKKKYEHLLEKTKASCCVVPSQVTETLNNKPIIRCKNPNLAFKKAAELILPNHIPHPKGIHEKAVIADNVTLGKDVSIGCYAVLESGSKIGDGTVIYPHCYIGCRTEIGKNSIIYPNVTIRENIKIGNRVIIHPGSVIGSDGYGYEATRTGHQKIPHIGDVIIEDDVEIGACTTVDRAKIAHTKIGRGTKIDNLVQVAHNVTMGPNCIIVSQCGISGSVKIGKNVIMGGQVGMVEHIEIGDNVMIGAKGGVIKSIPAKSIMAGIPVRPIKKTMKILALEEKLPEIYERLKKIEKKLGVK
ncbi:MAG: UDP-3-O-(3-hydroxymyristoyl)glucosamine N-acyltransferase [Candidatus Omnitrophica bacterium]|nr:UDP-3-O-(3-hydroxymyristoyl)glucosamine N-acyltransferase [Candidatus Omnitrophota bacterium]